MRISTGDWSAQFDFDRILNVELMAVEDRTGWAVNEWQERIAAGSMKAITALVWVIRRRTEPGLAFDAVTFEAASLEVDDEQADEVKESSPGDGSTSSSTN